MLFFRDGPRARIRFAASLIRTRPIRPYRRSRNFTGSAACALFCTAGSRTVTAGGESHPAPKLYILSISQNSCLTRDHFLIIVITVTRMIIVYKNVRREHAVFISAPAHIGLCIGQPCASQRRCGVRCAQGEHAAAVARHGLSQSEPAFRRGTHSQDHPAGRDLPFRRRNAPAFAHRMQRLRRDSRRDPARAARACGGCAGADGIYARHV